MAHIIRRATREDAATMFRFVCDLAKFENALDEVKTTQEGLSEAIFGPHSVTHALIAEMGGKPAGFAVYFFSFSTWLGQNGVYLEDLYVSPEFRGAGLGKALLQAVAKAGVEKDCGRMEWSVLDWNEKAIRVYDAVGGKPQNEWIRYRLEGQSLSDLAKSEA